MASKSLFHNYGILWYRHDFKATKGFLGKRKAKSEKAKTLFLGKSRKSHQVVDFIDQIGVYIIYDEKKEIIYAGLAGKGKNNGMHSRLYGHFRSDKEDRMMYYSWFGIKSAKSKPQTYRIKTIKGEIKQEEVLSLKSKTKGETYSIEKSTLIQHLEALLLEVLQPSRNKRGPDWKNAERFDQFDPNKTKKITINEIKIELENLKKKLDFIS